MYYFITQTAFWPQKCHQNLLVHMHMKAPLTKRRCPNLKRNNDGSTRTPAQKYLQSKHLHHPPKPSNPNPITRTSHQTKQGSSNAIRQRLVLMGTTQHPKLAAHTREYNLFVLNS